MADYDETLAFIASIDDAPTADEVCRRLLGLSSRFGLNLQHSGHIVVWLSLTWSLEDYTQANARVDRQGQERPVQIHRIIEPDTVDARKLSVLAGRAELAGAVMEELRRDYLTGVYNARYLDTEYRRYAEPQAQAGKPVGVVMARVNEYWSLRQNESANAADCCLNMAAGILQLSVGTDDKAAVLARLEDGLFAVVTVGTPAAQVARKLQDALDNSRREFSISLSRRGSFTVQLASAEWGETPAWDMMFSLAQQRL